MTNLEKILDITEDNILAIDPATKCGWAMKSAFGIWDLSTKKDESGGMKLIRLRSKLAELCDLMDVRLIVYERPGGRHSHAMMHQSRLIALIELFCEDNAIEYAAFSASQIKKFATGKGNSGKGAMIKAAQTNYAYEGEDDNEADALHLLHLAIETYLP